MDLNLTGRVVVVTGAGSGIGRATATYLAEEGARVACLDVDESAARETAAAIRESHGDALPLSVDVSQELPVRRSVDAVVQHYGGIDVLMNGAGIGGFVKFADMTMAEWSRVIGVNLTGTFLMCHAAIPHLLQSRSKAIVNIASIAGLKGQPYSSAYGASKGGVVLLTRGLAIEYAKQGMRVNCVCPGGVRTNMLRGFLIEGLDNDLLATIRNPTNSFCEPIEVAKLIAFLASEAASHINGVSYAIDGGTLA